ncbi:MAG TPA: ABC transporter substrate-binding protein [Chitinolyticbacter sp.]|nr:ABC transporter substrate-binding protein [Chitinolyticbacter sp.]
MLFRTLAAGLAALLLSAPLLADTLPKVIRIGVSTAGVGNPPRVASGWTSVAQVNRYVESEFAKDGVKVEWIFFKGQGPAVNEAISNNQLDFTTLGDLPAIIGRAVGLETRVVLAGSTRGDVYVAATPQSGITDIKGLRGKRIAFHKGTATQLAVNRILTEHGLSERDVKVVNMEPATYKAAFLAGDVDAIFSTLDLIKLADAGKARIIYTTKQNPAATSQGFVLVNQKFAQAYPRATQRVVNALVRAAYWAGEPAHRDAVFQLWGSAGSIAEATYRREYTNIPLSHRLSPRIDEFVIARTSQGVADAYKYKLIRKPFDVRAWFDSRYLETALKELQYTEAWPRFDAGGKLVAAGKLQPAS